VSAAELAADVGAAVDRRADDVGALVRELVAYRSENPKVLADREAQEVGRTQEESCQKAIAGHLREAGLEVDAFEAMPGREDVVGTWTGTGGGRSLILNGPTARCTRFCRPGSRPSTRARSTAGRRLSRPWSTAASSAYR
jgi:hypothetical protein